MSNVRHLNQQNPFWEWISQFDNTGSNHPFSNAYNPESRDHRGPPPEYGPPHHEGPPPPPNHDGPPPPPGSQGADHRAPPPHDNPFGAGLPFGGRRGGAHHGGPHGHHAGRGGWGSRRGGNRCSGNGRGFTGWPMDNTNFDMSKLSEFISQFIPEEILSNAKETPATQKDNTKDFSPEADIFDTEDAYVVHISLPGAKKEDVGVNWDADKSELNVAGVVYRPGDEAFLKQLALDERRVGVFERKVKLGSKQTPALVDAEGISARMEDGVLMVTMTKVDSDIVEVKKVDIE